MSSLFFLINDFLVFLLRTRSSKKGKCLIKTWFSYLLSTYPKNIMACKYFSLRPELQIKESVVQNFSLFETLILKQMKILSSSSFSKIFKIFFILSTFFFKIVKQDLFKIFHTVLKITPSNP